MKVPSDQQSISVSEKKTNLYLFKDYSYYKWLLKPIFFDSDANRHTHKQPIFFIWSSLHSRE